MGYKLTFELVPDGCWGSNLRNILTASEWNLIKKISKQNANGKCSICGKKTTVLDAHEQWVYDEKNKTQKLVGIISVCRDCHAVIHIGRTQLAGNEERAEKHFIKVNGCSYADYRAELGRANLQHQRLNKVSEWLLDVTYLKEFLQEYTRKEK